MIGKFAVLLLVAVCAIQGQAKLLSVPQDKAARDLASIEQIIKDIVAKIQHIIEQVGTNLSQIIKDIENKINEIINGLSIDDIIQKIKQTIEAILGQASEAVTACIDKQQEAITQLAQDEQNGAMACAQAAADKVADIKTRAEDLLNKAMAMKDEITTKVEKCVADNQNNLIGLVGCLTKEVVPMAGEVMQMEKDLVQLIADAQKVIPAAAEGLNTCMNNLAQELAPRQQAIINDIKKCLMGQ